jgi:hypothetical protein
VLELDDVFKRTIGAVHTLKAWATRLEQAGAITAIQYNDGLD